MTRLFGLLSLLVLLPCWAATQVTQQSALTLQVAATSLSGEWKMRVADLSVPLRLDSDHDGTVTWPEIEHRRADIESYLGSHLSIASPHGALPYRFGQLAYGTQGGEPFLLAQLSVDDVDTLQTLRISSSLPAPRPLDLTVIWSGQGEERVQLQPNGTALTFNRAAAASSGFLESFQQGVWHIWTGYDHILFLIVLLIPAVFARTATGRAAVTSFQEALLRVVIIVSAFTVAHSITLACAASGWITLPSRLVESVIAASIFVAALNNFLPRTAGGRSAWLAFGFGLIHGFGFAGALAEIGDRGAPLWRTLLAFNLGVEIGQLAIVAVFLPLAFLLRQTRFYRTGVLYGGSALAGLCALLWFWQRAFGESL
jgi:hypothetical protein